MEEQTALSFGTYSVGNYFKSLLELFPVTRESYYGSVQRKYDNWAPLIHRPFALLAARPHYDICRVALCTPADGAIRQVIGA